ncbi:MAG: DUF2796 domain-containing protein [Defluviicoccus sp.]|nr:DUF2796 domain-containing protein [Defluviicoccus sp.]
MRAKSTVSAIAICLAAVAAPAGGALAAEGEHKPHVHGESKLNLAVEGNVLEIELESPAHDVVGFEHMPKTAAQRDSVKRAVTTLKDGAALFRLSPGAGCKLQEAEVETPLAEAEGHKHEEAGHKEGEHAEEEVHSEFEAHYRFRCADPAALKSMEVKLFESFGRMEEIELGAVLPAGQRAMTLKPGSSRFDF